MSGNFDFPPATRRSTSRPVGTRAILQQRMSALNALRAQMEMASRAQSQSSQDSDGSPAEVPPYPSTRRHFNARRRAMQNQTDQPTSTLMEHLENVTSTADSLLGQPIPSLPHRTGSPDSSRRDSTGEGEVNRRRKRRKIDHEERSNGVGMAGFRYGHRGSVVSGPLKMEIDSCDGGITSTLSMHGQTYCPENVLRNDQSVYCTHQSLCNLILKHKGDTNFSLTKLIIKSPDSGFTAPVQEGLVFMSMTADDLVSGTAGYRLIHAPSSWRPGAPTSSNENSRPLSRRRDSTYRHIPPAISDDQVPRAISTDMRMAYPIDDADVALYRESHLRSPPTNSFSHQRSNSDISADCDGISSDEEEPSSPTTLEDRRRRDIDPPSYQDFSDENDTELQDEGASNILAMQARLRREARGVRGRRLVEPSFIDSPAINPNRGGNSRDKVANTPNEDDSDENQQSRTMTALARFFIKDDRNAVSIKFDPPVAGKYLLLKLWSPCRGNNIDIQSVIAYGFAGPRYFPAEEML